MELASASVVGIGAAAGGARVSVPELMQQLQVTQNELENIKVITSVVCLVGFLVKIVGDCYNCFGSSTEY